MIGSEETPRSAVTASTSSSRSKKVSSMKRSHAASLEDHGLLGEEVPALGGFCELPERPDRAGDEHVAARSARAPGEPA